MNILVCVKRVPLTGGKIVLTEDERAISTRHLGFTISPHEECGCEEAIRLVEQHGGTSTVLTLGPPEAEEQLRDMLAIGIGRDVYKVPLPAVVTVKEGINLPRYPSVPGRLRAKRKPVDARTPERLEPRLEMVKLKLPPGSGKQVEILGRGPEAAPAVVEILK